MEKVKKRIVLASGNAHKIREIASMLPDYEIVGYKDFADFEIEDTGETFYENARIKAETVSKTLKCAVLADDSGICVEALNGAPGIYSARYAGDGNDEHNNDLLLKNMEGKKVKTVGDGVKFERIRRITGYLVGTLDRFNNAKKAEVADRVTHGTN